MWLSSYFTSSVLVINWDCKRQKQTYCIQPSYFFTCRMRIMVASSPSANPECQSSLVHNDLVRAIVKLVF